jgi:filamentous hemagglutinin family protein
MKRPSLNHTYRLVWSAEQGAYVAVPEFAKGRGKGGRSLVATTLLLAPALALAGPTGGVVTSGNAAINTQGAVTNITQATQKAAINWQGFSVAAGETVNFKQPNSAAVTLNRVIGNEKSVIDGALNANGKVFLVNSNGVLFGQGASVSVGGLVASTLNISDEDFNAGNYVFKSAGGSGSVINLGTITAKDGGYVALLSGSASNQGLIAATKGTVALAAGNKITLNFNGDSLLSVTIDEGALNALVENKQAIYADGGTVLLTAKAADELLGAQVNNSGVIQARTIDDLKGSITLYAHGGTTNVDGTLDASAPTAGDGGSIETSGTTVNVADTANITTAAANGANGTWLIDPTNFTIAYGSGSQTTSSIGATTLQSALANGNVSIATQATGSEAGDININAAVTWTAANSLTLTAAGNVNANAGVTWSAGTLTLNAGRNVNVNATLAASATGNFAASWGNGSNADGTPYSLYTLQSVFSAASVSGAVNMASTGTGTVTLNGDNYTVIRTAADFSKIGSTGHYALGADLTATNSVSTLTAPLGSGTGFAGTLEGFGHTVSLGYNATTGKGFVGSGLFDTIAADGLVRNLRMSGRITAPTTDVPYLGSLANINKGTILNAFSGSTFPDTLKAGSVGGMVGLNEGTIMSSFDMASPYVSNIGGSLVGTNAASGVIKLSFASGYNLYTASNASATYIGGLVGVNYGTIDRSWSDMTMALTDTTSIAGGLVGFNAGTIDQSYSLRAIRYANTGPNLSGFVGVNTGTITNSYSTLTFDDPLFVGTTKSKWVAAFAYQNSGTIADSYATSYAYDTATHAGFVYDNTGGTTTNDYWYADHASTASAYGDNSTAKQLSATQAADFSSYAGFSTDVWAKSTSGYPVLKNTVVYVVSGSTTEYGSDLALLGLGLQGGGGAYSALDSMGNAADAPVHITTASGYVDAGGNAAASVLGSSTYTNLRGLINVSQKTLTFTAGTIADKTYDGTTTATQGVAGLAGLVGNQTLNVSGVTGTFADANAGSGKTVTVTGYTLSDGSNGGKASNYKITNATTTATIDKKALTVTADVADKVYDGSTAATASNATLTGLVGSDTATLASYTVDFTNANAGTDKSVVFSNATLTGTSAGNYTVSSAPVVSGGDITPRPIELFAVKDAGGSTTVDASKLYVKNVVVGDAVGLQGSVSVASTSTGVQAITDVSHLATSNANYTVVGAVGSVLVGNVGNLVLDQVASGSASIATNGSTTTVTQTSDKAIIDWLRFSVGATETLNFVQPSSSSIVLNRITGNEASVIAGALNANGKVFIVNSSGVLFKAGSSVNAAALVASTQGITDANFASGHYLFTTAGGKGSIVDDGSIVIVDGGFLALLSENGVTADGFVATPGGQTILASAQQLTLNLDGGTSNLNSYAVADLKGTTNVGGTVYLRSSGTSPATLETAGATVKVADNFNLVSESTDTWSYTLPSLTVGSSGNLTGNWVSDRLAKSNLALNALTGDLTLNDAITWSSDAMLTLAAASDIDINKSITATGTNAGLTLNYGDNYHLLTKASYSGAVLDANGDPVADAAPAGTEYASITLSGSNATLKMNGHSYTLIHSVDQLDALDQCVSGLCYDPGTGTYSQTTYGKSATVGSNQWWNSSGFMWNPNTQAYDIPLSTVVNGVTYYYNPETLAYDQTTMLASKANYYYDATTGTYTHLAYSSAAGKYWNPITGQYDLATAYSASVYFNGATGKYDKFGYDTTTGKYYNQLTGAYDLAASKTSVSAYYYDTTTGLWDLSTPAAVTGYYALAGDLDAAGTTYGGSLLYYFSGTLAGLGHSIDNLTIASNTRSVGSLAYKGMIDQALAGTVIRDLGLVNANESFTEQSTGSSYAGALVGTITDGTLSQVYSEGGSITQSPAGSSAGLVGYATRTTIEDSYSTMSGVMAGLAIRTYGGSVVRSHSTGSTKTAGLVNYAVGTLIANDYATGDVANTTFTAAGGLVATYSTDSTAGYSNKIINSFATGNVSGSVPIGGLVGTQSGAAVALDVINSYATGNVNGSYSSAVQTVFGIGGLIGYTNYVRIDNAHASGNVTIDSNVGYVGGLIGYMYGGNASSTSTINNSYATGNVVSNGSATSFNSAGGLVGNLSYANIDNSYATGNVTGYNVVGGLVGSGSNSKITNSYTTGLITATKGMGLNTAVGGIVGNGQFVSINNTFYNAELNANRVMGGFGNPGFGSYYHNASTGLTTGQMADVSHYADGTIDQVLADRAAAAEQAAAQQAAAQAAQARQAEIRQDTATRMASNEVTRTAKETPKPAQLTAPGGSGAPEASALDRNIVFDDVPNYTVNIRRVEIDGVVYMLEADGEADKDGKGSKTPAAPR